MVARVFQAFGSGVCEALPVQLVNDIFFLHERGTKIGYYTVCFCLGATGPLYAGYMLAGEYSWRLFFYVEIAFAGVLLLLAFFFVEETLYHRKLTVSSAPSLEETVGGKGEVRQMESAGGVFVPKRKSYFETLKPWSGVDPEARFFKTMLMPFTYFFVPAVFWVITSFGEFSPPSVFPITNSSLQVSTSVLEPLLSTLPFP